MGFYPAKAHGAKITIDGIKVDCKELKLKRKYGLTFQSITPFAGSSIGNTEDVLVVYRGKMHNCIDNKHYVWDGETWSQLPDLSFRANTAQSVTYKDKINVLGATDTVYQTSKPFRQHYTWDGETWSQLPDLPYYFRKGIAVVLGDKMHIMGGAYSTDLSSTSIGATNEHYAWDGETWTKLNDLPHSRFMKQKGRAVAHGSEIYIMGGTDNVYTKRVYKWDGETWTRLSDLPYESSSLGGGAAVLDDVVHDIVFGTQSITKFTDETYEQIETPVYSQEGNVVVYDNDIHITNCLNKVNGSDKYNQHCSLVSFKIIKS